MCRAELNANFTAAKRKSFAIAFCNYKKCKPQLWLTGMLNCELSLLNLALFITGTLSVIGRVIKLGDYMKKRIKKGIFMSSLTYGAIITAILDYQFNFHIITYLLLFSFIVLLVWYRFNKRLSNLKVIESRFLSFLFPIIIVSMFGYKIAKINKNINAPNIEGEWRVIELYVDNEKIDTDSSICNRLIFWKHGIMFLKEKGVYNLRYHFGLNEKLIIDGGAITTDFSDNYCVERTVLRNMDIANSYDYILINDTLRIEDGRQVLVLEKKD